MSIKRATLVQVDWLDAEAQGEWTAISGVSTKPSPVHSVGYVLHDNDAAIVLAGDVGDKWTDEETVNRTIVIPRGMVTKVRRL